MVIYSPPENATSMVDTVTWINSSVNQWLFQGIIGTVFIVALVTMLKNQNSTASKAVSASAFVCMILSVFARTLNFIPTWYMTFWIAVTGLAAIWMYVEGVQ